MELLKTSHEKKNRVSQKRQPDSFYKYTSMAGKMILIILAFTFGGHKLDEQVKIEFPVFTLIFILLGVSLAIYSMIKDLLK